MMAIGMMFLLPQAWERLRSPWVSASTRRSRSAATGCVAHAKPTWGELEGWRDAERRGAGAQRRHHRCLNETAVPAAGEPRLLERAELADSYSCGLMFCAGLAIGRTDMGRGVLGLSLAIPKENFIACEPTGAFCVRDGKPTTTVQRRNRPRSIEIGVRAAKDASCTIFAVYLPKVFWRHYGS